MTSQRGPLWIALVVLASVVGGLAGAAIDHGRVPVSIDVVISVIIGGVTAFIALRRLMSLAVAAPSPGFGHQSGPDQSPQHGGGQARRPGELRDPVLVLPIAGQAGPSSPWWELAGKPRPGSAGERDALRPHELDRYQDAAFIAQCPRCGAFELDADQDSQAWTFHCYACDCRWSWRPGTAWPPVQVRPKLRTKRR
ncbi:MAG TPA: hypothetical protein VFI65_15650 [Streptosporangiaceae bacterium]|nr:hypothetical protein [Streptosporangiaceae bacterium]